MGRLGISLLLIIFFVNGVFAQSFRVTGYFNGDLVNDINKIEFSKITDLNIAFVNPDVNGNFPDIEGLKNLVERAHLHNVKVFASLGGGSAPSYYATLINPANRDAFILNIQQLIRNYNLDGIDVDLEGDLITGDYEGFFLALAAAIKPTSLLTAAISTYQGELFTSAIIAQVDYITIMSYDKTGPWNPSKPGPHSTYSLAVEDLTYWYETKGVPKEKINLGLPFYGYGFNGQKVYDLRYHRIVTLYPGAEAYDQVNMHDGGILYYNGIPTIRAKTNLALREANGVSIWHLMADTKGDKSLLKAIDEEIKEASVSN